MVKWCQLDYQGDFEFVKKCSISVVFRMHLVIEHEKPSYKEPPKEVCFYAYKRINHFREILAQFQAKGNNTDSAGSFN